MVLPIEVEELIASLRAEIAALRAEAADLRRQLGRDGSNSSQPTSSDGLRKKPRIGGSLRGRSDKTSGGQTGHKGGALRQLANPDHEVRHAACGCGHCGLPLDPKSATGIEKRQVFDLPERPLLVTQHQASIYRCAHCRGVTKAVFPEGVVREYACAPRFPGDRTNHRRENVCPRLSRSSASCYPSSWRDLRRRSNADSGLLSQAGDYATFKFQPHPPRRRRQSAEPQGFRAISRSYCVSARCEL